MKPTPTKSPPPLAKEARDLLARVAAEPGTLTREARAGHAEALAEILCALAATEAKPDDTRRAAMLARLTRDPAGQAFTTALTDRLFRSRDPRRVMKELRALLERHGVPAYLRPIERTALRAANALGRAAPALAARGVSARVREETRSVLLSSAPKALRARLEQRHREGVRVNVNQLGEALLGEREAEARVQAYEALAREGEVDALSVKVSSIGSQLNLLAFEETTRTLAARLSRIYASTLQARRGPGEPRPLVMLDMEAYQDLELTFAVMKEALSASALRDVRAGVVLQAYLPDSNAFHRGLLRFAKEHVARGGHPLRLRIVKGANLAHERVESERSGLPMPTFHRKEDVDANYKRLLERALTPEALATVSVGVASHNLFDVAYALVLRAGLPSGDAGAFRVGFELLKGMADPLRRALLRLGVDVLVYAPTCGDHEMNTGIAYLVRRLDENTASDNFLASSFGMEPRDASFERERLRFRAAVARVDALDEAPLRAREPSWDRGAGAAEGVTREGHRGEFRNAVDTDFSRARNRAWVNEALARQREAPLTVLHSCIAGSDVDHEGEVVDGVDPSRPGMVPYRVALASGKALTRAIDCAAEPAPPSTPLERAALLGHCARALATARGALVAAMVMDGGKRVVEADLEVSEAIDFAEYYRASYLTLTSEAHAEGADLVPRGAVVVTPPWNFPLAIAAGGVLAALVAGNRVILKPPPETALVGARLAEVLWAAGVSRRALQLVFCDDEEGSALVRDPRVSTVVLTGATDTARAFQRLRPGLYLLAETGGKNAYLVSAMSDRELAIRDAVHSAFGHAGQKCSAVSLLICEAEVYDDPHFRETLKDAVESLPVGSSWSPKTFVTPLIHPPRGALARALDTLEPGESWLVTPQRDPTNPRLVSPGVKLGVRPGSFTHLTELFGPVLGVMRADSLEHALALANQTGYGLTAGLATLDDEERDAFVKGIRAGNVYVNRTTTGAIVERQPFGGFGKSGFGPGAKAGGPNYVVQLCRVVERSPVSPTPPAPLPPGLEGWLAPLLMGASGEDAREVRRRAGSYVAAAERHFSREHAPHPVLGQSNVFRYLPCEGVSLRVEADGTFMDLVASACAARLVGASLDVSIDPGASVLAALTTDVRGLGGQVCVETMSAFAARARGVTRVRVLGSRTAALEAFSAETGAHLADAKVLGLGRFELLHFVKEQSVSVDVHRYGHLERLAPG